MEEYCQPCQRSLLLCLWELRSQYLPCVYPSKRTLNEINKFGLNWQLVSKVIILSLMSPHWNGRRLGLYRNTTGCGKAVFSNTKKWRVMAARVYLSRFLNTHTHTHAHAEFSCANPVLFKQFVSHSTLLQTWPVTRPYIPFPWVLAWLVSRRTPDCAGCVAACLVWERAWTLRLSNLGLPSLFVNSCRSNRTTLSPAKCFLAAGGWTDRWESEVKAQILFQANK